ncbi:pol polyprotein [Vairimorpha ceranae]|uniref:Pol polyprotein n=1 Tax=Vairimorpha ceranae TaxID=40302 RepID=A0A0F9W9X5_9MICR|nr:pol polyprotein [Vairimorpha ceranae]KKO73770.1 pol polyprotein [Vairimorpha ceranae]
MLATATTAINISIHIAIGTSPLIFRYERLPNLEIGRKLGINNKEFGKEQLMQERNKNFKQYKKHIEGGKITAPNRFQIH